MKKQFATLLLLISFTTIISAQSPCPNLINNGDFETYSDLPSCNGCQLPTNNPNNCSYFNFYCNRADLAANWFSCLDSQNSPCLLTPDYFHTSGSSCVNAYQPYAGQGYVGMGNNLPNGNIYEMSLLLIALVRT
jgi:hypothetical protein